MTIKRPGINGRTILAAIIMAAGLTACVILAFCGNNPWPSDISDSNAFFSSFSGDIKTLDPATSYYEHESTILDSILEMPFEYHYLKRPYELVPMLAEAIPVPRYFDKNGKELPPNPSADDVFRGEYDITFKPGVMYQPHPCFAKDPQGKHIYLNLEHAPAQFASPNAFPNLGTRELTAEDFKVAITRLCDPKVASPVFSNIKSFILGMDECSAQMAAMGDAPRDYRKIPLAGVEITGTHSLKIILKRKYPQLLHWMSMHFFAPMPWEALAFYDQPCIKDMGLSINYWPVGTGAYIMDDFVPNSQIILSRNINHRADPYPSEGEDSDKAAGLLNDAGKQAPFIDKCVFLYERESVPGWIKFLQGYYDMNPLPIDASDAAISIAADGGMDLSPDMKAKGISLSSSVRMVSYYYGFNMLDSQFGGNSQSRKKLRQAISIAIDTQESVDIFSNGRGCALHGILPPGLAGGEVTQDNFNPFVFSWDAKAGKAQRHPIARARELLVEAGFPNGIGPDGKQLTISYDNSSAATPGFKSQFLWLKEKLAQIGIDIIDNGSDLNRFRDKMATGNWQFMRKGWVADYPDQENFLFLFYSPNAHVPSKGRGANYTNYTSKEYDDVFQKLETMPPSPERSQLIKKANHILREDSPCVWDNSPTSFNLTHSWLKNFKPHEVGKTFLKFRKIDMAERNAKRREWNKPPVALLCLAGTLFAISMALFFIIRRKQD